MARILSTAVLALTLLMSTYLSAWGRNIDRVVAYIGDRAITLRELKASHERAASLSPGITIEQTLESMINKLLLLKEATDMRLSAESDDELISKYLDLKVKPLSVVLETEVQKYYRDNRDSFKGLSYREVKSEIRKFLEKQKYNSLFSALIKQLRDKSEVRILYKEHAAPGDG